MKMSTSIFTIECAFLTLDLLLIDVVEDLILGRNRQRAHSVLGKEVRPNFLWPPNFLRISSFTDHLAAYFQLADELLFAIEEETAAPLENAWELMKETPQKPGFVISTGCDALDSLLGGGVFSGEVTEVFGHYTTGKSQLAMSTTLQAVLLPLTLEAPAECDLGRVWYLDSSSNFSAERLAQIFENNLTPKDRNASANEQLEVCMRVLERVQVFDTHNATQVLNILSQLNLMLQETYNCIPNTNSATKGLFDQVVGLKLVVIDALGVLFAPIVSMKHPYGRMLVLEIAQLMRTIATSYNIAFLVINHSASSGDSFAHNTDAQKLSNGLGATTIANNSAANAAQIFSQSQPQAALGKYWARVPSVQVMLKYPPRDDLLIEGGRVAELRKSSHAPTGPKARANFTITHKGVDKPLGGE